MNRSPHPSIAALMVVGSCVSLQFGAAIAAPLFAAGGFRAVAALALVTALTAASLALGAARRGMLGAHSGGASADSDATT